MPDSSSSEPSESQSVHSAASGLTRLFRRLSVALVTSVSASPSARWRPVACFSRVAASAWSSRASRPLRPSAWRLRHASLSSFSALRDPLGLLLRRLLLFGVALLIGLGALLCCLRAAFLLRALTPARLLGRSAWARASSPAPRSRRRPLAAGSAPAVAGRALIGRATGASRLRLGAGAGCWLLCAAPARSPDSAAIRLRRRRRQRSSRRRPRYGSTSAGRPWRHPVDPRRTIVGVTMTTSSVWFFW